MAVIKFMDVMLKATPQFMAIFVKIARPIFSPL